MRSNETARCQVPTPGTWLMERSRRVLAGSGNLVSLGHIDDVFLPQFVGFGSREAELASEPPWRLFRVVELSLVWRESGLAVGIGGGGILALCLLHTRTVGATNASMALMRSGSPVALACSSGNALADSYGQSFGGAVGRALLLGPIGGGVGTFGDRDFPISAQTIAEDFRRELRSGGVTDSQDGFVGAECENRIGVVFFTIRAFEL